MLCTLQLAVIMGLMLGAQRLTANAQECPSPTASTCEECISSSPHCAWCKDKHFYDFREERTLRCGTREALRGKGCAEKHILDPKSQHTSFDSPRKEARTAARLSPQKLSLELHPGRPLTFEVQVKKPRKLPVELYYLSSGSFAAKDGQHRAAHLGTQVLSAVQEVAPESQSRGFGLFGDQQNPDSKSKGQPGISFSHSPSLSDDLGPFSEAPGHGAPEGGLLALMQAAVCVDVIGWSNDNTRMLVYASDHEFHVGEGQTRNASGANGRGQCHLTKEELHINRKMDYPSIGELANSLTENNIQVIFAVTEEVADKYKELSEALPKSTVAVLPSDLHDIKATITEAYNRLWSSWAVRHTYVPGMNISYSAECPEGERRSPHRGECSVHDNSREVSVNVTVSMETCLEPQSFHIQLMGSPDKLGVQLKSICACECGDTPDPSFCSYSGKLSCGVCQCDPGYFGTDCSCSPHQSDAPCRQREGGPVCSGRGQCICGQCSCDISDIPGGRIFGQYCECDDFSCEYHEGKICGGNGRCECGTCVCVPEFEGSACQSPAKVDQCMSPDGLVCSNHGTCQYNSCKCEPPYAGPFCETCPTCEGTCQRFAACVECLAFGSGRLSDSCATKCANVQHKMVDTLDGAARLCRMRNSQRCLMTYAISRLGGTNRYEAQVKKQTEC
ncbi:hypothetical protein AGOR_G00099830 [Albula goreensis]|uniref:Integrin beta n=1 Tax=Albula goreensis TaxID=1534307 RepID=A0A8T3DHD5_9TELE|nr:hypothetical protein AGOR_G00099830 [Albula goreensis]